MEALRLKIRDVPDFPKPGILFKDLTPALSDPAVFRAVIDALVERYRGAGIQKVVAIESRGFIFGAPLALGLGAGLTPVRKAGKLPYTTIRETYALEYGEAVLELHADAIAPGERVLVVDDLLATGGTAAATGKLIRRQGGVVAGYAFAVELGFLGGGERLGQDLVFSLLRYD